MLARYPFLPEIREYVGNISIEELLNSSQYGEAKTLGLSMVFNAFKEEDTMYVTEPFTKLLAYHVAKLFLIALQDPIITQRFANRMRDKIEEHLLGENDEIVEIVANAFRIKFKKPSKEISEMHLQHRNYLVFRLTHFTDFVRYASRLSGENFRLLNQPLLQGWIPVSREIFIKLIREAFVQKFVREIEDRKNDASLLKKYFEEEIKKVREIKNEFIASYSPATLGSVEPRAFPPCIQSILNQLKEGMNLPHQARFYLVTFLHKIGLKNDEILKIFSTVPDFREDMTKYQIAHITGKISGKEYSVPKCETLRAYGLCVRDIAKDKLCMKEWMSHPLLYYKLRKEYFSKHSKSSEGQ